MAFDYKPTIILKEIFEEPPLPSSGAHHLMGSCHHTRKRGLDRIYTRWSKTVITAKTWAKESRRPVILHPGTQASWKRGENPWFVPGIPQWRKRGFQMTGALSWQSRRIPAVHMTSNLTCHTFLVPFAIWLIDSAGVISLRWRELNSLRYVQYFFSYFSKVFL